jgi:hypothetical protein
VEGGGNRIGSEVVGFIRILDKGNNKVRIRFAWLVHKVEGRVFESEEILESLQTRRKVQGLRDL